MPLPADELHGSGDVAVPLYAQVSLQSYLMLAASVVTLVYLLTLKACFNTYHLPRAIREERQRVALEDEYKNLFSRREEVLYHINWTKQSGSSSAEADELKHLGQKLRDIDEQITAMEKKIVDTYNAQGVAPSSWVKKED